MDSRQFQKIYSEYSDKIYSYILWITRCRAASDDILQSVFLKVWKANGGPSIPQERTRWIYTVARNACRDFFRGCSRFYKFRAKYSRETETSCTDEHSSHVWQLLEHLSETDRSIIYLHIKMGYQYNEIGRILSMSAGHVRIRAFRALKQLRNIISEKDI